MKTSHKKLPLIFLSVLLIVSVVAAVSIQAAAKEEYEPLPVGTVPYVDNDTAVRGEYTPFEIKAVNLTSAKPGSWTNDFSVDEEETVLYGKCSVCNKM